MKYSETYIALQEFPDEITLAVNISGCPIRCPDCHSPWLHKDAGRPLTARSLDLLISKNRGITCVGLMGGDGSPLEMEALLRHLRESHPGLKTGLYSGRSDLSALSRLIPFTDYLKNGPYVREKGGLDSPETNQRFYKVEHAGPGSWTLTDWTWRFWKQNGKQVSVTK